MYTQASQCLEFLDQYSNSKEVQTASENAKLRDSSKRKSSVAQLLGLRHGQKRKIMEIEAIENSIK